MKTNTDFTSLNSAEKEALKTKFEEPTRESLSSEYLACLFLLLADNDRFEPLQRETNYSFLMGGETEQYSKDVLFSQEADDGLLPAGRSPACEVKSSRHGRCVRAKGQNRQRAHRRLLCLR